VEGDRHSHCSFRASTDSHYLAECGDKVDMSRIVKNILKSDELKCYQLQFLARRNVGEDSTGKWMFEKRCIKVVYGSIDFVYSFSAGLPKTKLYVL